MEKLWTTTEAAACLGVSEAEVEQFVKDGKLTGYRLGGRFLRFRPDQVEALCSQIAPAPAVAISPAEEVLKDSWWESVVDFWYFYDFYVFSAALLAALGGYLIWSSGFHF